MFTTHVYKNSVLQPVMVIYSRIIISRNNSFTKQKHWFCTFNNDYNKHLLGETTPRARLNNEYPFNVIIKFKRISQLRKWKETSFIPHKFTDGIATNIYSTLILQCVHLNEFKYAWQLFEECRSTSLITSWIYMNMFQVLSKETTLITNKNRKGASKAMKLFNEMKMVYSMNYLEASIYGTLIKLLVSLNEFKLGELIWNEYIAQYGETQLSYSASDLINAVDNNVEHWTVLNAALSLYRKQNNPQKVFEIYNMIINYRIIKPDKAVFNQVLICISQIIRSLKSKQIDSISRRDICSSYIICAERIYIDAYNILGDYISDPLSFGEVSAYSGLSASLMECYGANGNFYKKCRNFWKYLREKDIKYLKLTFSEDVFAEIGYETLNRLRNPPLIDAFCLREMISCLKICCSVDNKYKLFDNIAEYDVWLIISEIFSDWDKINNEKQALSNFFFEAMSCFKEIMESNTNFNLNYCYLNMFKLYNITSKKGIQKSELSMFYNHSIIFFKYCKVFTPIKKEDIIIVHNCWNKQRLTKWIETECNKYKFNSKMLLFKPRLKHKTRANIINKW